MKKILFAFLLVFFASTANAEELINFYEVKDVPVTQQGDNLALMRDKAISEGQRKAMDIFQDRLKSRNLIPEPMSITDSQINEAIDSIEVRDEKIYTRSYRAKLNIVFSPRVITRLFNVAYVKPSPPPDKYLVIPIMNDNDGTKIWRHKWWDVVQKLKNKNLVLPLGDLEDVRSFTREDYAVRDFRNLLKLQKKYNSTAILLAVAEYIPSEQVVNLGIERIKDTDVQTYNYEIKGKPGSDESQLLAVTANNLLKKISTNNFDEIVTEEEEAPMETPPANMSVEKRPGIPKGEKLTPITDENRDVYQRDSARTEGTTNSVKAEDVVVADDEPDAEEPAVSNEPQLTDIYVIAQDMISWGRIRQKITNTELVTNIRIKSFTAGKAFITLTHKGDFADVITSLEAVGLEVSRGAKYWEVREKKQ